MSEETLEQFYEKVKTSLQHHELQRALLLLMEHIKDQPCTPLKNTCRAIESDYKRLLDFMAQGGHDPQRGQLQGQLQERIWRELDCVYHAESWKLCDLEPEPLAYVAERLTAHPHNDSTLGMFFCYISEMGRLNSDERKLLIDLLLDEQLPLYVRSTMLGGAMLSLTQYFDDNLVEELYPLTFDDQPGLLQVQALVTLVLVALIHAERIDHYPRLQSQYALLCEDHPQQLFDIQLTLLQCLEANHADQPMTHLTDEDSEEVVREQLHDFIRSIQEGIDTSITLFEHLKKLPFFARVGNVHHWFMPFDLEQPEVQAAIDQVPEERAWLMVLQQSVAQTNTDKYASFFSMQMMGSKMLTRLGAKMQEAGLVNLDEVAPIRPLWQIRNVLHDFYRYCTMCEERHTMVNDPFVQVEMYRNPWLEAAFANTERISNLADYLYERQRYGQAADLYEVLIAREPKRESLKHCAIALREQQRYDEAIALMTRSLRLYPVDNKSAYRIIADCHNRAQRYEQERETLERAQSAYPDEKCFLWRMGRCLIALGQAREALEPLYKLDLRQEHQPVVDRYLTLAMLLLGELDKAQDYLSHLLADPSPRLDDLMLAGHIALRAGDYTSALSRYREVRKENPEAELFDPTIRRYAGITEGDIALICEILSNDKY